MKLLRDILILIFVLSVMSCLIFISYNAGKTEGNKDRTFREATQDAKYFFNELNKKDSLIQTLARQAETNKTLTYQQGYQQGYNNASENLTTYLDQIKRADTILMQGPLVIFGDCLADNITILTINTPTAVTICGPASIYGSWYISGIQTGVQIYTGDSYVE